MEYNYDQCPECGYINDRHPDICPSCGYDLANYRKELKVKENAEAEAIKNEKDYRSAIDLFLAGKFKGARSAFLALGNYKDSANYAAKAQKEIDRQKREEERKKEEQAALAKQQKYNRAKSLLDTAKYYEAISAFRELGEYLDSKTLLKDAESLFRQQQEREKAEWELRQKKERKKHATIISIICAVIIGIIAIIIVIASASSDAKYSEDNIIINITERINSTEKSVYKNGYIVSFSVKIQNNSSLDIRHIEGILIVYNKSGEMLDSSNCTFDGDLIAGEEHAFTLNLDREHSDKAFEFYYSDFEDLKVTFKLTKVTYENQKIKEYEAVPQIILTYGTNSDGISSFEKSYQNALTLFNEEKYSEAQPLFEALGRYKDSASYYHQCYTILDNAEKEAKYNAALALFAQEKYNEAISTFREIVDYKDSTTKISEVTQSAESKAKALAETGNYDNACAVLAQLGYTEQNNNTYKVYSLASQGYFADAVRNGLTVVVIPQGAQSIPDNYFKDEYNQYRLQKVVLPSSITSIGKNAFAGCEYLTQINLPNGLLSIGAYAFSGCTLLNTLSLPNTLQAIGANAFSSCSSITSVALPSSLVSLGNYAYSNCSRLSTLTIPGNVKTISESAFIGCSMLTNVTIANGVEKISASAFRNCTLLASISLPVSLTEIGEEAFYKCSSLTEITIPASVTSIGRQAFYNCSSLEKVYFLQTQGWTTSGQYSPSIGDYRIIDVTDAETNATRFRGTLNYWDARWYIK